MYRTWDRMDEDRRSDVLKGAQRVLDRLDQGSRV